MTLIAMKNNSSMITTHCQVVPMLRMNGAIFHSAYMPSMCGEGNFRSTIIIFINGDECPIYPDDINGRGRENTRHVVLKKYI